MVSNLDFFPVCRKWTARTGSLFAIVKGCLGKVARLKNYVLFGRNLTLWGGIEPVIQISSLSLETKPRLMACMSVWQMESRP